MVEAKTKILLFGRTGSGKSTIANMLIKGNLDPPLLFDTGSGVRGKTELMQREETEAMVVVDTVGFGEADGGTVSHEEAKLRLYDFFVQTTDEYNYFAYVHKWGKTDYFHENLWQFFKDAFEGVEDNFIIIFTHSKPDNIAKHLEDIQHDFSGCQRYVSVDFAGIEADEDPSCAMARRKHARRNRSINCLKDEIMNLTSKPKPATAPIRETLSKGRLLLIGRYALAIDVVASSLVAGPDTAAPIPDIAYYSPSTFKALERSGRGWSVVSTVAFESYQHRISTMDDEDGAREIASHIIEAVRDGSYSHFIYVEGGGPVSKLDKYVWRILQDLLEEVQDNLVALIVNTKWPLVNNDPVGNSNDLDNNTEAARKVRKRFQGCRFVLYLDLPLLWPGDAPDALQKKTVRRKDSLIVLERALCSSVTPRVAINIDAYDELNSLKSRLTSYLVPIVQAVKHPKSLWLKEFDPLSKLSKSYRELSSEKPISPLSARGQARTSQHGVEVDTVSQSIVGVDTTQLVVVSSYMSHIYLEMTIGVAPLESIYVEVESRDTDLPWNYPEDQGSYEISWTWGELSIMDHRQRFKEKRSVPRLRVYTNRHASSEWQLHKKDICRTDPQGKHFLENVKNGDKLILWLRNEYPKYSEMANYSRRGLIRVTRRSDFIRVTSPITSD